ncbi:PilZ domain-containing protein [Ruminiclostridium herbifermentans]|uniref:PilZ domain-containing protein n=1 Tax=Ruminiclostridium herbifermentans TaxID=2488810 RepID=A0A4U7JAW3_9FIRM|nr:PilZ domain-containing protein [Ruminiclostridium herbifermentans]QNU67832.1 PilZ domain-containing protein [Ruminiclostridium herbifermentans]
MQNLNLVLKHYSKLKPIKCTVLSGDIKKLFTVKLCENESNEADFLKGDPVLIGLLSHQENIEINGGSVVASMPRENCYIICSNEVEPIIEERRKFNRFPTSLLADIKQVGSSKREAACIKDISYSGMCIYSPGDFEIDSVIDINLYFSTNVMTFEAGILRKSKYFGRNEYGLQIIHRDKNAMYSAQSLVASIIQNEKDIMLRHLSSLAFKV